MGIVKPETVCPVADVTIGTCSTVAFHLWHPKTEHQSTWCPLDASLVDDLMQVSDFTIARNARQNHKVCCFRRKCVVTGCLQYPRHEQAWFEPFVTVCDHSRKDDVPCGSQCQQMYGSVCEPTVPIDWFFLRSSYYNIISRICMSVDLKVLVLSVVCDDLLYAKMTFGES